MRRRRGEEAVEKILDVDASMQGTLAFKDPVNLRINGKFEGKLETKGSLTIGEHAVVNADINCENITVAGRINGAINAQKSIKVVAPGCIVGDIKTPTLSIDAGAVLEGHSNMMGGSKPSSGSRSGMLTIGEVAKYLEVDQNVVVEWADTGKLPATKEGSGWRFDRSKIENWLTSEKIR